MAKEDGGRNDSSMLRIPTRKISAATGVLLGLLAVGTIVYYGINDRAEARAAIDRNLGVGEHNARGIEKIDDRFERFDVRLRSVEGGVKQANTDLKWIRDRWLRQERDDGRGGR